MTKMWNNVRKTIVENNNQLVPDSPAQVTVDVTTEEEEEKEARTPWRDPRE